MKPSDRAADAYEKFSRDSNISEVCIVDEMGIFQGIITRSEIMKAFSGRYGYNLHQKHSVSDLMNRDTLIVNSDFLIENVSNMAMERLPNEIYDAVVVLKNGFYYGVVTIKDLLSTAVTIQVKRATEVNPLTQLPGNVAVENQITHLLGDKVPYAIMYLDLDNFKAYNDAYGFNNGDKMIKALAASMDSACSEKDFLGHIGGDDFVIITRNKEAVALGEAVIICFKGYLPQLYNQKDWDRGYIISKNRNGLTENFPIASVSIAVVTNWNEINDDIEKLSQKIVKAKKRAKKKAGNSIEVV